MLVVKMFTLIYIHIGFGGGFVVVFVSFVCGGVCLFVLVGFVCFLSWRDTEISLEGLKTTLIYLLLSSPTKDSNLNLSLSNSAINFMDSLCGCCFSQIC